MRCVSASAQCAPACAARCRAMPGGTPRRPARLPLIRAASDDTVQGLQDSEGIRWVFEQENALRQQSIEESEAEAARVAEGRPGKFQPVGMHIRGKATIYENVFDENDPARFQLHRQLAALALHGDYEQASELLGQMTQDGFMPGPRAYHAVIFSNVRGGNVAGALAVLQEESNAGSESGFRPLPESYAVVVEGFAQEGDLDSAEAVYASNRRAGVDACKSWCAIVAALFEASDDERAFALLAQGEAEDMVPNAKVYTCMIEHLCCTNQLDAAFGRLVEMQERGVKAGLEHLIPIIQAQALDGDMRVAEELVQVAYAYASGPSGQQHDDQSAILAAYHTIMEGLLYRGQPPQELSSRTLALRQQLVHTGLMADAKMHSLFLEAALIAGDVEGAKAAVVSLECCITHYGPFEYLPTAAFVDFLWQLSASGHPGTIYKYLAHLQAGEWQAPSGRIPLQAAVPQACGCTFLGAWLQARLQPAGASSEQSPADSFVGPLVGHEDLVAVRGEYLHTVSDAAVGGNLEILATEHMSLRQLRAELKARNRPAYGAQHKLAQRLQAARGNMAEGAVNREIQQPKIAAQARGMLGTIKLFAASKELVAEEDEGFDSEPADLHLPVDLEVEGGDDSDEEDVRGAAEDEDGQDMEDVDITLPEGEDDLVDSARRQPTTPEDEEAGSDEEEDESTPRSWWRFRSRQITDADPEALEAASKYAVGHLNCAALFADDAVGVPEAIDMFVAAMQLGILPSIRDLQLLSQIIIAENQCLAAVVFVNQLNELRPWVPDIQTVLDDLSALVATAPAFLAALDEEEDTNRKRRQECVE